VTAASPSGTPAPAGSPPYVSVIITAYNRRTFLPRAIDSVLAQTFPREGYEILVVKNFDDEAADRRIREHGLVGILCTERALGIHLKLALDRARGEVTAFLNDDDLWEPTKLAEAAARFRADRRLGFLATSYTVIDEEDRAVGAERDRFTAVRRFAASPGAVFRVGPAAPPDELDRFLRANPGSDSTIAIRTPILRRFARELAELPSSVDTFLLTCGLLSGLDLVIEYRPLTRLRVHPENMSRATDASMGAYLAKYARTMTGFADARAHLVAMAEAAGNRAVTDRWTAKLRALRHFASMASGTLTRREAFGTVESELRRGRAMQRGLVASALLYLLSPRLCRSANFLLGRRIAGA
jgi:glycosyltransferase involved in cell wall biosynthesis